MEFVPDCDTMRRAAVARPATAMVQCDLVWLDARAGRRSRRGRSCRRQLDRLAERGLVGARRHRARVHRLRRHLRGGAGTAGYRDLTPANQYNVDYSILGTDPGRAAAARHPQRHVRRRPGRRGRQGRVQLRPARDRLPATPRRSPPPTTTSSTRRPPRRSPPSTARRSRSWPSTTSARATPATSTCRCAARDGEPGVRRRRRRHGMPRSTTHVRRRRARHDARLHAALRAEHQLLQAVRRRVVRADRGRLGPGQPHLRGAPGRARRRRCGWRTGCRAAT